MMPDKGMAQPSPPLCPYRDAPGAARMAGIPPRAQAWTSVPLSPSLLDRVAEELRVRSALRKVIALAERSSALSGPELRARLAALAGKARAGCPECATRLLVRFEGENQPVSIRAHVVGVVPA
ncbi:MAG TPA: hypothetical protein VFO16_10910 [Pseudonocardiaceae bacterium]|nr:hypothetical protein [Pseudonocardiaceae bacterium]